LAGVLRPAPWYNSPMRTLSTALMSAACLSLVALQMSGLHMHVNTSGNAGLSEVAHAHGQVLHEHDAGPHLAGFPFVDEHATDSKIAHHHAVEDTAAHEHDGGQNHAGDLDVSIVKFGTGISKLLLDLISLALILLMVVAPADSLARSTAVPRLIGRHERWRPPLRAPPRFSFSPSH
jgi:hypothetical protein